MTITLGAIFVLLLLSAFFSGSETALTAVSRPLMHRLEQNGDPRAAAVNRLHDNKERLIGALLLGNNFVNIAASALATGFLISVFGEAGVVYATAAMTLVVLVFAEILPKTYAIRNADSLALRIVRVVAVIARLFAPLTIALNFVARQFLKLLGSNQSSGAGLNNNSDELRGAIELHERDDQEVVKHERGMLRNILDLSEAKVVEIMTHRRAVTAVDADLPNWDKVGAVLASPYSRVPIWKNHPDNIVGVLHTRSLLRAIHAGNDVDSLDLGGIAKKPWFIPENTSLLHQLQAFRHRREHFAVVVDEYGSLAGIITLEDIIEEIVGEIDDEHDVATQRPTQDEAGCLVVEGSASIRDLNREFEWSIPDENAITVAGLILHETRKIPQEGQSFEFANYRFEVLKCSHREISSVRILRQGPGG